MTRYVCKVRVRPEEAEWTVKDLERGVEVTYTKPFPEIVTKAEIALLKSFGWEITVEEGIK